MFQFTHPGGVRLRGDAEGEGLYDVSIHAPGRGATEIDGRSFSVVLFQFTHPGGVRPGAPGAPFCFSRFQFTHPGGVRRT